VAGNCCNVKSRHRREKRAEHSGNGGDL
jgi:hypothetical protein